MWERFKEHFNFKNYDRHQWEALFWLFMIPFTLLWFKESVLWVALMSLYANWKTADGAHEAHEAKKASEASNDTPT